MKNIKTILKYIIAALLGIFIFLLIIKSINFYDTAFKNKIVIEADFTELKPIDNKIPVYYHGIKIGKLISIKLSDNSKYTIIKMVLCPQGNLPKNVTAEIKNFDNGKNYLDIIYPDKPSKSLLGNGATIKGENPVDIESFISNQISNGNLPSISKNINKTLNSFTNTSNQATEFFTDMRSVLQENRDNLKNTTENTSLTLEYLSDITYKLDKSLDKEKLNKTTKNIHDSSENILETTQNMKDISKTIKEATKNIDKTIEKIDKTVTEAQECAAKLNCITNGVHSTMCKRCGGIRVFLGRPCSKCEQ